MLKAQAIWCSKLALTETQAMKFNIGHDCGRTGIGSGTGDAVEAVGELKVTAFGKATILMMLAVIDQAIAKYPLKDLIWGQRKIGWSIPSAI